VSAKALYERNTDAEVSSHQAPLCLVAVQRLFTVSDQITFGLATGTQFLVTTEMPETIPGSLRMLLLNRVDGFLVSAPQGWVVGFWTLMLEITYACGDRESPA